jgi:hypothetical protein
MSGRDLDQLARKAAMTPLGADFPALTGKMRAAGNPTIDQRATWDTLVLNAGTLCELKTTASVHLSNAKASFEAHELEMLATQSEGMSGRDIKNWIIKAQKHAAHLAVEGGRRVSV